MNSSPYKCSLFWVSVVVIAASLFVWNGRQQRRQQAAVEKRQLQTQRVAALLFRTFHTDNYLTYSALSKTTARMGDKKMESVARITHAPRRLLITYLSGDFAGLSGGYNQHWSWRQVSQGQPMVPYAELERPADEMAAGRFALLLENYKANWNGNAKISGHEVAVVQLSPMRPVKGARGPARKLWIDAKTGLTLRQQSFNYQMVPVMESTLSEVSYSPQITPATFVTPEKLQAAAQTQPWMVHDSGDDRDRVTQLSGLYPPEPKDLPNGFQFDSVGAHRCESCEKPCYAVLSRYTDGLNTLTVFAVNLKCGGIVNAATSPVGRQNKVGAENNSKNSSLEASSKDALQSCDFGTGTLVMRDTKEGHLIAVADLPAEVLQRVLESTTVRVYNSASSR